MGGRANPLRDAAAMVGIGQTEFAEQFDRPEEGAQSCLVTSGEGVPTGAVVLRAA